MSDVTAARVHLLGCHIHLRWTRTWATVKVVVDNNKRCALPFFYTPGQLRDAVGITKETFRYWKRELPELAQNPGHSPHFGPGALLATAILKQIVDVVGVSISRIAPIAPKLFAHCRETSWPELERSSALLFFEPLAIELVIYDLPYPSSAPLLVIPLQPVIGRIREHLLESDDLPQASLAFPPVAVSAGGRS